MIARFVLWLARVLLLLALLGSIAAGGLYIWFSRDLPDYHTLTVYQPAVLSRVYANDGTVMGEFAREKRVFMPLKDLPPILPQAFIAAEDGGFYQHSGIDWLSLARAMAMNVNNVLHGRRMQGASTITQQVVKNMLTGNDRTWQRKVREAILALHIERAMSKDQILELYLNQIFLGGGAYGVASAARVYFNKLPHELTIPEAAFLAGLPKSPTNYHPLRYPQAALKRRNVVLERMFKNTMISAEQLAAFSAEPLKTVLTNRSATTESYFAEDVRRQLLDIFGEKDLYGAGFTIMTSQDNVLQQAAQTALQQALQRFDRYGGYRGPLRHVDLTHTTARQAFEGLSAPRDVANWRLAVLLQVQGNKAMMLVRDEPTLGSMDIDAARRTFMFKGARVGAGDVVYVEKISTNSGISYALRQVPAVNGAVAALDPRTGRVLAMQGGFSYDISEYNRATQALRQPGSAFKPFVYAAALDKGFTPTTMISDAPITLDGGNGQSWSPKNFDNESLGVVPMRIGLERSRNLMTVRIAQSIGMDTVADYVRRMGVMDQVPVGLSSSLGSGETTLLRMLAGYGVFASGGKQVMPSLIDTVYDRNGHLIMPSKPLCAGCISDSTADPTLPPLPDTRQQVLDNGTAFQITDMLQGVVKRGTARLLNEFNVPLAGKTGTTNDAKDLWFVGYTPNLVVGCYLGYDEPRSLGHKIAAGEVAVPLINDFLKVALPLYGTPNFVVPPQLVAVTGADGIVSYNNPQTAGNKPPSVIQNMPNHDKIDPSYDEPMDAILTPPKHDLTQVY